jgi:hypothetical protein
MSQIQTLDDRTDSTVKNCPPDYRQILADVGNSDMSIIEAFTNDGIQNLNLSEEQAYQYAAMQLSILRQKHI